ncbi:hypothetical protein ACWEPL_33360 [Nonomuraea sp. NPDC004186]
MLVSLAEFTSEEKDAAQAEFATYMSAHAKMIGMLLVNRAKRDRLATGRSLIRTARSAACLPPIATRTPLSTPPN